MIKEKQYEELLKNVTALIEGECDSIAVMSTIVCELKQSFESFHWVGFYRVTEPQLLKVGPYQGTHGCLQIPFTRGVCGKAASDKETQVVSNVHELPYHIACSSSTQSEIVVPVYDRNGTVVAVLDIDSDNINQFDNVDKMWLERLVSLLGVCY